MQRVFAFILLLVAHSAPAQSAVVPPPSIAARTWLLLDLQSGQVIAQRAPDERIEPASLTKLLSAYVVFDAVRQKELALDQQLRVSTNAARMPGSRVFLQPETSASVDTLMRGMIVVSGNDATVALAEGVAGSEEAFVDRMNAQARRLGLTGSHFTNATGRSQPQHYSTTSDLMRLASALIEDYPQYLPLYQLREFTYNGITQPNSNWLLGRDPRVDGLKSGYTEDAGYCLIATARRDDRRLLAIVTGAASESARAIMAQKLLNYGFQHYQTLRLYAQGAVVAELPVWKGSEHRLKAGVARDLYVSVPRGQGALVKASLTSQQPLLAPVSREQRVGVLHVSFDGKPLTERPVVALESVGVANIFVRMWDSVRLLFD